MRSAREGGRQMSAVVIGVGNEFRRDDGAGPEVVARLRGRVPDGAELVVSDGEPARMIEAWEGVPLAGGGGAVGAEARAAGRLDRAGAGPGARWGRVRARGLAVDDAMGLAGAGARGRGGRMVHGGGGAAGARGGGLPPAVAAVIAARAAAVLRDLASPPR